MNIVDDSLPKALVKYMVLSPSYFKKLTTKTCWFCKLLAVILAFLKFDFKQYDEKKMIPKFNNENYITCYLYSHVNDEQVSDDGLQ